MLNIQKIYPVEIMETGKQAISKIETLEYLKYDYEHLKNDIYNKYKHSKDLNYLMNSLTNWSLRNRYDLNDKYALNDLAEVDNDYIDYTLLHEDIDTIRDFLVEKFGKFPSPEEMYLGTIGTQSKYLPRYVFDTCALAIFGIVQAWMDIIDLPDEKLLPLVLKQGNL